MEPNPAEAAGGRSGMAAAARIESGRWQVANKGTVLGRSHVTLVDMLMSE